MYPVVNKEMYLTKQSIIFLMKRVSKQITLFKKYSNVAFEFWHFPPGFVLLKLTCLVTLFDRKLHVFKNWSN